MTRNSDPAITSATQLSQLRYRLLCEVRSLTGGNQYLCSGDRFIYAGNTYSPIGGFGGADPIQEDSDPFPRAVRCWFSLLNSAAVYEAFNETLYQKEVLFSAAWLTDSYTVVGTPQSRFRGSINKVEVKLDDPQRGNFMEIEVESRLRQAPTFAYYSESTLQAYLTSGDTFFSHLDKIPFFITRWGALTGGYGFSNYPRGVIVGGGPTGGPGK